MRVKELIEKLNKFPSDMEVVTKKTEFFGNIGYVFSAYEDTYGFFGKSIPCVVISDEDKETEEI